LADAANLKFLQHCHKPVQVWRARGGEGAAATTASRRTRKGAWAGTIEALARLFPVFPLNRQELS